MTQPKTWHSNGKLLLTGEYLVMDGAKALAVPVNKGQSLQVEPRAVSDEKARLNWTAFSPEGLWFDAVYQLPELSILETSDDQKSAKLKALLQKVQQLSPEFLKGDKSFQVTTRLEFAPDFGWGSSSTLVSNLAYWAGIDPFELQRKALGGSGYDIACARNNQPVFYQLVNNMPVVSNLSFEPSFSNQLYYLYLGQKQNTEDSIRSFREKATVDNQTIQRISQLTEALASAHDLKTFESLLQNHEEILSGILGQKPVKERLFSDYPGMIKSLGAWGGDFVLVTRQDSEYEMKDYFSAKGYSTLYSWNALSIKL